MINEHDNIKKKKSKNPMAQGLLLLVALFFVLFLMSQMHLLTQALESVFTQREIDLPFLREMDSLRVIYYKQTAGFWEHSSANLYDRIELKDNGIIWRYTEKTFAFPYDKIDKISCVSTSFLQPARFTDGIAVSNLRVINEVWFMPDTCFGRSAYDVVAKVSFSNDTLFFDGAAYTRYEGELKEFFPENSLNLLKPSKETINMKSCEKQRPLMDWLRENLIYSFDEREIPYDMFNFEREQLLKKYYIPYCLSRIENGSDAEKILDLDLTLIILPDGSVDTCFVKGKDFVSIASKKQVTEEVKRWKFPTISEKQDTLKFVGKFIKKQ
ncbi:MAG: hypothetical protein FWF51_08110 [Chitinivibrionia bacterium]|nr:hypothetical protein [Chitinivibrionia bacterium]